MLDMSREQQTPRYTSKPQKKKAGPTGLTSSPPPPICQTNHASGELHNLPRYVARRSNTTALGGLSLNQLPHALVGSRNVSLSLNATPARAIRIEAASIPKAFVYGGLVTIQSTQRDPSVKVLKHSSEDAS